MSRKSTSPVPRKVWRMSANAPLGEIVSFDPAGDVAKPSSPRDPPQAPRQVRDREMERAEWPETDWQASSYALLSGCQVKDYTERIPDRVFDVLFKDE